MGSRTEQKDTGKTVTVVRFPNCSRHRSRRNLLRWNSRCVECRNGVRDTGHMQLAFSFSARLPGDWPWGLSVRCLVAHCAAGAACSHKAEQAMTSEARCCNSDYLFRAGYDQLCRLDARFEPFRSTLFSRAGLSVVREQQSAENNAKLDASMTSFLELLSSYFLLAPAFKALEYLIRRYGCVHAGTAWLGAFGLQRE